MKALDPQQFFKYTRMTVPAFEELLSAIKPHITCRRISDEVSAEEKLAMTLHFLSQGGTMQSVAWAYKMGLTTVNTAIYEVCEALWEVLSPQYVKMPTTQDWKYIAERFSELWNFPNCVGSLDGKHINIQAPARSGSLYYNYKGKYSIILLASCDSNYNFTLVDIGAYGGASDGGVFQESAFGKRLENHELGIPPPTIIPSTTLTMPYMFVADAAFPLKDYMMRPYPGRHLAINKRIFNYRLSRARRTIENAFGILVARWRVLKNDICAKAEHVDNMVKAVVVLHNYCKAKTTNASGFGMYCPKGYVDSKDEDNGDWRRDTDYILQSVTRLSANNAKRRLYDLRDNLATYFNSAAGMVPWQMARVFGRDRE